MKWGCQQRASFASGHSPKEGTSSKTSSLPNSQITGASPRFKTTATTGMGFSRSPYSQPVTSEVINSRIVASSAAELAAGEARLAILQSGIRAPVSHKREAAQDVALNLARDAQMLVRSGDAEDSGVNLRRRCLVS